MDTVLVVLVLIIVLVLLAGIGYFFVREAGQENVQQWLTAPKQLKQSVSAFVARPAASTVSGHDPGVRVDAPVSFGRETPGRIASGTTSYALENTALRELREEFRDELRQAAGLTRDFDARLTRMESTLGEVRRMPDDVGRSLRAQEDRQTREFDRLQQEIGTMRFTLGRWGERRGEALADVYGHLARVEVALSAVVNPMLLPGETLVLPAEFTQESLQWDAWGDVGERAFAFGNAFNQNRYVLDEALATQIEAFIMTLRQGLTRDVFPAVRDGNPTDAQVAQMRTGLAAVIVDLPGVRRTIEVAYREIGAPTQTATPATATPSAASPAAASADDRDDAAGRGAPVEESASFTPDPQPTKPLHRPVDVGPDPQA